MIEQVPLEFQVRGSEERQKVALVLRAILPRKGRAAAISMHEIAARAGIRTRLVQAIVKFLVEEKGIAIGTATTKPYGYFRVVSESERRAVRDHFIRRALSNLAHAKAFDSEGIVAQFSGQLPIDFPEQRK